MNRSLILIKTIPTIIHHNSALVQVQSNKNKTFIFQTNKKVFNVTTKITEKRDSVMMDSYVEWYDFKQQKMRRKRFLQVFDCEDQDFETTLNKSY